MIESVNQSLYKVNNFCSCNLNTFLSDNARLFDIIRGIVPHSYYYKEKKNTKAMRSLTSWQWKQRNTGSALCLVTTKKKKRPVRFTDKISSGCFWYKTLFYIYFSLLVLWQTSSNKREKWQKWCESCRITSMLNIVCNIRIVPKAFDMKCS